MKDSKEYESTSLEIDSGLATAGKSDSAIDAVDVAAAEVAAAGDTMCDAAAVVAAAE